jgi:hypothetical protein
VSSAVASIAIMKRHDLSMWNLGESFENAAEDVLSVGRYVLAHRGLDIVVHDALLNRPVRPFLRRRHIF